MKKTDFRILLYIIIGFTFGILDWFYLDWLASIAWGSLGNSIFVIFIIVFMNYGIWLLPVVPLEIIEARRTGKSMTPVIAGMFTWSSAIFSYYVFYAILLSLGKLVILNT